MLYLLPLLRQTADIGL